MNFSIQEIINKAVMPDEQRAKTSWWATDMGKCLRGVYYARQGVEPTQKLNERNYRVFQVGKLFEEWVIEMIGKQENGIKIIRPETIRIPEWDLSVRPDLIVEVNGEKILYEIKSVHSRKFWWMQQKKEGPDMHYLMQTWTGLMATGIEEGRLIYFSKDDLCVAEYSIKRNDDEIGQAVFDQINILQEAWKNQIPPEPIRAINNGKINWQAMYCPYHTLCMNDDKWLLKAQKLCHTKK